MLEKNLEEDSRYLEHVKEQIVVGIRQETATEIQNKYSWTDQLNAVGAEAKAMKADIKKILKASRDKREAISACKSFKELEKIVPRKKD